MVLQEFVSDRDYYDFYLDNCDQNDTIPLGFHEYKKELLEADRNFINAEQVKQFNKEQYDKINKRHK